MKSYNVRWEIEIDAETPEDAARVALRIQRDVESTATVFEVQECETMEVLERGEVSKVYKFDFDELDHVAGTPEYLIACPSGNPYCGREANGETYRCDVCASK